MWRLAGIALGRPPRLRRLADRCAGGRSHPVAIRAGRRRSRDAAMIGRTRRVIPRGLLGMLALVALAETFVAHRALDLCRPEGWEWWLSGQAARRQDHREAVLCFGSSMVKQGVLPRVVSRPLGKPAYNLAMCAGPPPASYFLLRRARQSGARPARCWSSIIRPASRKATLSMRSGGPTCWSSASSPSLPGPPATLISSPGRRWPGSCPRSATGARSAPTAWRCSGAGASQCVNTTPLCGGTCGPTSGRRSSPRTRCSGARSPPP